MDKRTLIAVVLSLVVLIGWSMFQKPPEPQKNQITENKTVETTHTAEFKQEKQPYQKTPAPVISPESNASNVVIETDLYKAVFSTKGAIVKYWELKTHPNSDGSPVVLLKEPDVVAPLGIIFQGPDRNMPQGFIYSVNKKNISLSGTGKKAELVFNYSDGNMSITKTFVFYSDNYKVNMSIESINTPSYMLPVGTHFGVFDKEQREHKGPVMLIGTDREEFDSGLEGEQFFTGNVSWIAQEDKYFATAIIPITPIEGVSVWKEGPEAEIALKLAPQKHDFILYIGPKEYDTLKELNAGLEHIVDFGWFSVVAMPLFWVLKFFYSYLGNYGWSIIVLTIVVRIPFIPILHKSQQSMKKMQKVQPMMAELKEKYKKDQAKLQKETMALYKKHKVNPVGGCLPMFLQIPVFIALYNVLLNAIELRGAPFVLWITDLAVKDPYYVFPIVMGATMVLQQKMTPSTMDPKQAKMMMLMPIVFTFMFLSFPAGLVIYWLINNILGIIQQHYANVAADKKELEA